MRRGPPASATARATVMVMATAEPRATAPPRVRATASAPAVPVTDMPVPARDMPEPVLAADTPVAADTGPGTRRAAARLPRSGNARLGADRFTSLSHLSRALSGAGFIFPSRAGPAPRHSACAEAPRGDAGRRDRRRDSAFLRRQRFKTQTRGSPAALTMNRRASSIARALGVSPSLSPLLPSVRTAMRCRSPRAPSHPP